MTRRTMNNIAHCSCRSFHQDEGSPSLLSIQMVHLSIILMRTHPRPTWRVLRRALWCTVLFFSLLSSTTINHLGLLQQLPVDVSISTSPAPIDGSHHGTFGVCCEAQDDPNKNRKQGRCCSSITSWLDETLQLNFKKMIIYNHHIE